LTGLCLPYNHFQAPPGTKIAYPFAFVCSTLNSGKAALFAIRGLNRRLFAALKNGISSPNRLYLSRPFSLYAIREKCTHLTRFGQARHNRRSMDLMQNKGTLRLDSDVPRLEALQCFKLSGRIRPCAILQQLRSAITISCIRRFCTLNPLFRDSILCAYTYIP
jgi:hypothetical protein